MTVLLALAAAALFALGTVLQQREAMREPEEGSLGAGFIGRLARRPIWLAGIAADGLGFVGQAAALGVGRMVVVQPILAMTVIFSLPLGAKLSGQRISPRDVLAAGVTTGGLALFLALGNPSAGRDDAPVEEWLIAGAATAAICGPLVIAAAGRSSRTRAALLGIATGILWGLSAGITKATVDQLDEGLVALLTDWHVYALIVVGAAALVLSQASLQTGALAPAIATASILDPLASLVLGVTIFAERLEDSAPEALLAFGGLAVALVGLYYLAGAQAAEEEG
ncbi:MAG TPA: DMT family transporter [Solirubrobacterales bacterium]|nr:DMT family transporter [Solirubrobacterales bacterium]